MGILSVLFMGGLALAAHQHGDKSAVHGMAVVGEKTLYLSHLPMFHSPHDYQVILEAEFDGRAKEAYRDSRASHDEPLYTIEPENFVLPEMVENPRAFRARLYRGHFERGGEVIAEAVTVKIKRVIFFRKFVAGEEKPGQPSFLLFGQGEDQFLAHRITAKPDFDQILSVRAKANPDLLIVSLPRTAEAPLKAPGTVKATTNSLPLPFPIELKRNLYEETGDLSF